MSSFSSTQLTTNILSAVEHKSTCSLSVWATRQYIKKIYWEKSLETLIEEVFIYYNADWCLEPRKEKLFELAVSYFYKEWT